MLFLDDFYKTVIFTSELFINIDQLIFVAHNFIPYVLFLELPFYLLVIFGILRYYTRVSFEEPREVIYYPKVSCVLLCYAEGEAVIASIKSLTEQIYPGTIEIIAIIDGAVENKDTHEVIKRMKLYVDQFPNRSLNIIPKWKRGGRVSSINIGMNASTGEVLMILDGDTSFDNNMVRNGSKHFADNNVVAVSGNLRVRNYKESLIAKLQSLEYMISIQACRLGLSEFNTVNNVSGAFGIFRRSFVKHIYGWDSGTAEDLDLTFRIKQYFGKHKNLKILFEKDAIGHTNVPTTIKTLLDQRLRWDGDLFWLYFRKHQSGFTPKLLGWINFISIIWYGILFQIVMPFMIVGYTIFSTFTQPGYYTVGILVLVYAFYIIIALIFFLLSSLLISERKSEDLKKIWLIPIFPIFMFFIRLWAAVATITELFLYSNKSSSMAPYWVLKRVKF